MAALSTTASVMIAGVLIMIVAIIILFATGTGNSDNFDNRRAIQASKPPFLVDNYVEKSEVDIGNLNYGYFDKWGPAVNFVVTGASWKSNPGVIGTYPAIPLANQCSLGANCPNYTFGKTHANVCHECAKFPQNYENLDKPIYVYARSAGFPRQKMQLINYR